MSHILILPSWYPVDKWDFRGSFFREQAIALQKAGHKVGVIHPNMRSLLNRKRLLIFRFGYHSEIDEGVPTFQYHNLKWFQASPPIEIEFELHFWKRLYNEYVKLNGKPDLAHVHSMLNAGLFAHWLLEKENIPYVVTEHSTAYLKKRLSEPDLSKVRFVSRHARRRFGVSQGLCNRLVLTLGEGAGPWEELPNLVDHRSFNPQKYSQNPENGEYIFLCVASLWKKKGIHFLLKAFAQKFAGDPLVKLKIGGSGPQQHKLKKLSVSLGTARQVEFLGTLSRNDVPGIMAQADAFVLPSLYETFGVVLVEALMMGIPVISTKCGGPESILNTKNGLLVPTGEINSLANAIAWIRENHDEFDPDWIRKNAIKRFSVDAVVQRLNKIYADVIGFEDSKPV